MNVTTPTRRQRQQFTDLSGDDVLVEILSRLPIKALRRFQCVSKSWCALISSSSFALKHMSHKNSNNFKLLYGSMPLQSIHYEALLEYVKEKVEVDAPVETTEVDYPLMNPKKSVLIFGSCNGLICLEYDDAHIVLWNPYTKETNLLPQATKFDKNRDVASLFYGFGYDSKSYDYKVVRGSYKTGASKGLANKSNIVIEIFSLRSGSWRSQVSDIFLAISAHGYLVKETLHWVDYDDPRNIYAFNLAEEKFKEIRQFPDSIIGGENFIGGVFNIKNCLALYSGEFGTFLAKGENKIWIMKEYGVKESWSEVVRVVQKRFMSPYCVSDCGEVFGMIGGYVAWYDPKKKAFRNITETEERYFHAATYVESLVSPRTDTVAWKIARELEEKISKGKAAVSSGTIKANEAPKRSRRGGGSRSSATPQLVYGSSSQPKPLKKPRK